MKKPSCSDSGRRLKRAYGCWKSSSDHVYKRQRASFRQRRLLRAAQSISDRVSRKGLTIAFGLGHNRGTRQPMRQARLRRTPLPILEMKAVPRKIC